jgi:hypothetical protein
MYDTEEQQTERFQCLSTPFNRTPRLQVTSVDVTDRCGVRVSLQYSASPVQNVHSATTRCVSGNWVRGGAVGRGTALKRGGSRVRFLMGTMGSFIDLMLQAALWRCDRLTL